MASFSSFIFFNFAVHYSCGELILAQRMSWMVGDIHYCHTASLEAIFLEGETVFTLIGHVCHLNIWVVVTCVLSVEVTSTPIFFWFSPFFITCIYKSGRSYLGVMKRGNTLFIMNEGESVLNNVQCVLQLCFLRFLQSMQLILFEKNTLLLQHSGRFKHIGLKALRSQGSCVFI